MQPSRASVILRSPPAVTMPANGVQGRPAPLMGPPSTRPVPGGRPAMPPTPTSARLPPTVPHGMPIAHRPSLVNSEVRLPPLQTSPSSDGSRDLGVQVMSLNFVAKIKLLRTVAAPLSHSRQSIVGGRVRGAIIAVEGEDWGAVDAVSTKLQDLLSRDFEIRVVDGPAEPRRNGAPVGFADYMSVISEWHSKRGEMLRFFTGEEHTESPSYGPGEPTANGAKGDTMHVDSESSESRRRQKSLFGSTSSTRSKRNLNVDDEGVSPKGTASPLQPSSTPKTSESTGNARIPLLIIPHYILHTSNVWASALPINDTYSPADHWQWVATLWRGVLGADFTVYVRGSEDPPETAVPPGMARPAVDIREDLGALIVRGTRKVEEGSVRRVAFEVGEWARVGAMA